MKKIGKVLIPIILIMMCSIAFTGCNDDKDKSSSGSENETSQVTENTKETDDGKALETPIFDENGQIVEE